MPAMKCRSNIFNIEYPISNPVKAETSCPTAINLRPVVKKGIRIKSCEREYFPSPGIVIR